MLTEKKLDATEYVIWFIWNSRTNETNLQWETEDNGFLGLRVKTVTVQGRREFWGMREMVYILIVVMKTFYSWMWWWWLGCTYLSRHTELSILNTHPLLYVHYPQKRWLFKMEPLGKILTKEYWWCPYITTKKK